MSAITVFTHDVNHNRVSHRWGYGTDLRQGALQLGDVSVIVTAHSHDTAEASALACEAIAAHAQALADELRAVQQSMEDAQRDGALDNADPDIEPAGADDYLAEVDA